MRHFMCILCLRDHWGLRNIFQAWSVFLVPFWQKVVLLRILTNPARMALSSQWDLVMTCIQVSVVSFVKCNGQPHFLPLAMPNRTTQRMSCHIVLSVLFARNSDYASIGWRLTPALRIRSKLNCHNLRHQKIYLRRLLASSINETIHDLPVLWSYFPWQRVTTDLLFTQVTIILAGSCTSRSLFMGEVPSEFRLISLCSPDLSLRAYSRLNLCMLRCQTCNVPLRKVAIGRVVSSVIFEELSRTLVIHNIKVEVISANAFKASD